MEARGEKLLQSLVNEEKTLMAKVEEAKLEASRILADAESEAAKVIEATRERIRAMSAEQLRETESESDAIRKDILTEANSSTSAVKEAATANLKSVADMVMERVLP